MKTITREQRTKERYRIELLLFISKLLITLTLTLLFVGILYNGIMR